jgi:L-ascorbate metabolism protein UlaG (beta-lactamase superfamily)
MAASAQSSTESTVKESEKNEKCFEIPSGKTPLEMIYLEGNSWMWTVNGMNILVDPVLVGNLDFGIPLLYDAAKKSKLMKEFTLDDLPKLDCILITQGYDDHCHKKTLTAMVEKFGDVRVIASPNCEPIISKIGYKNVTYLEPRSTTTLGDFRIRASEGPVLGPPWQRPENGYFIEVPDPKFVIYYEPHCIFEKASLEKKRADVVVTPVNKQVLPGYTLVSGQEDAVTVAKHLQPKYIVTMQNAELDSRGVLSMIVSEKGTVSEFKEMLAKEVPKCEVLEPEPGTPFEVPVLNIGKN